MGVLAFISGATALVLFLVQSILGGYRQSYLLNKVGNLVNYNNPQEIFWLKEIPPYLFLMQIIAIICLAIFFVTGRKNTSSPKALALLNAAAIMGFFLLIRTVVVLCAPINPALIEKILSVLAVARFEWVGPFIFIAFWALKSLRAKTE